MVPQPFRITARRPETPDTWTLELEPASADGPMAFGPGQFNMVYAFGVGEVPISISGDPSGEGPLVHTVRDVGAVSAAICAAEPGQELGIRGPYGSSWPIAEAEGAQLVIVAGGVGLAPLRSTVLTAIAARERFERVLLFYGSREPKQLLYRTELQEWTADPAIELHVTVDTATAAWAGEVGVVTKPIGRADFDPDRAVAMLCGPEVMMRFAARALRDRGVPVERIHVSLERNMKCAVTHCGRCQFGPTFICREGAVMRFGEIEEIFEVREL
jgi:NAD(P)H-flavin reductase